MAKENGISRIDQDAWALRSHELAAAGTADGRFTAEIAPVYVPPTFETVVEQDNGIRTDSGPEQLARLRPAFDRKHGSVTAGNASPLTDGASAVILMNGEKALAEGITPMGYVRSWAWTALDPAAQLLQNCLRVGLAMQNTGAAVLFLPGIRHACKVMRIPISRILMPIGMCAILGGTVTMIGTSPLILLNDILPAGMEKFGLFELTPIGVGFVIAGILYFTTLGSFFLKKISKAQLQRKGITEETEESEEALTFYHDLDGPFELFIPDDYQ